MAGGGGEADAANERILKTDLWQYGRRAGTEGPYADNLDVDAIVVGGGFGGIYCLYMLRKQGYNVVMYEAGTGYGGTWRWVSRTIAEPFESPLIEGLEYLPRCTSGQPGTDL